MGRKVLPTLPRRLSKNRKSTAEKPFWPVFPIIFVKEHNYSPQMIEKSDSKWLSLATTPILGQSPSLLLKRNNNTLCIIDLVFQLAFFNSGKCNLLFKSLIDIMKRLFFALWPNNETRKQIDIINQSISSKGQM